MGKVKFNGKLKIHLENDRLVMYGSPTESSGCVLRGAVTLKLNNPTSFKSLNLRFSGALAVNWSLLINGYERKYGDQQILIDHTWNFLPPQKENHLLPAGNHSYEFELVVPGSLPESTQVAKFYLVQYQLKAIAERTSFLLPNYTCTKDIHLSRQNLSIAIDYLDPIIVANHWAEKVDYEISTPTKVYSFGDTIPISIQVIPLAPHLQIRYISCIFKEYMTCRAINGWFNGTNKLHRRIIQYARKDQDMIGGGDLDMGNIWNCVMHVKVPESMDGIQCDASNDSVRVRHKLKFTMSIENEDGHISELRAVLPVVIAITNSIGGLPAYEETWRTLPYDPALMMALLRQSNDDIRSYNLPSYSSIYHNSSDEESLDLSSYRTSSLPSYEDIH